jgi:hypothetical protein
MSWTLPVLAIAMTACAAGCGIANSDEYVTVDASQTTTKAVAVAQTPDTSPTETVAESTPAGSNESAASNPEASTPHETPVQTAGSEDTASAKPGDASPVEVSPEKIEIVAAEPAVPEVDAELTVIEPREVKLLVPERTFRKEGREKALRVTFDDVDLLKVINMDPVQADAPKLMPDWLKGLDGQRIRLRGFMYPAFQDEGIKVFILARDNGVCCFVRLPKVYDVVKVSMRDGETTDYIQDRPFDVIGVFHIAEQAEVAEDALPKLYSLTDAVVISR